ncbi:MAG: hypothetical protein G01um101448_663 [Parcubacteria group bacterium Gr01-1014_48]|nr:MAG: hypothetical protein Greene041614_1121 [Parcubacteria group bacterium Greene0416_14]TSC73644.1 MAG: hypothetical protein G01um101448_663 [Parcubacteria group bacterium Gr01-1014_48]TSD00353.1 MAG: hypothetical protein Greene101415_885 [Parcubacteria group bacterium Greene1014_15]
MRILIATGLYPPDIGGPATYSKLLFDKFYTYDVQVDVAWFGEVRYLPKIIRHVAYFLLVVRKSKGMDVIYAQDPLGTGFPAALAAIATRKRFFLKIVGDRAWEIAVQSYAVHDGLEVFSKKMGYVPSILVCKFIQRIVCAFAERVIVPSNFLKEIVSNWGVRTDKIEVMYNAFTPPQTNMSRSALREKLGLSGRVLVSVGRLVPWKGFEALITLMPKLRARYHDAALLIAGDGPDASKLLKLIHANRAEPYVRLLGKVEQKDLFGYIVAADVFVLNTSYEGLSHQLLEVMALGTPIVTTPAGGNRELITHNVNGYVVYHDDIEAYMHAISYIFEHPEEARRLTSEAQKSLSKFSETALLRRLSELLHAT